MVSSSKDAGSSPPLYQPLNKDKREIRLLQILPNTPDGKVNCKLHTVLLTPDLYYTCLSYVWGDPNNTEEIIVDGVLRRVTVTLATAFRHVKKHWIDIERKGDPKLNTFKFRFMMADIYSSAAMVLAWLSSNDEDVSGAFNAFQRIIDIAVGQVRYVDFTSLTEKELYDVCLDTSLWDPRLLSQLILQPPDPGPDGLGEGMLKASERLEAIFRFAQLEFWHTVCIHQEVVLAKRLYLLSPSCILQHSQCLTALYGLGISMERLADKNTDSAQRMLIRIFKNVFSGTLEILLTRFNFRGIYGATGYGMWRLNLFLSLASEATKDLDYIYGLVAVTKAPIIPDYNKFIRDVALEFMEWAVPQ
ncbi:heterokaryon incompatibility het-6 [Fusarium coicis]|nr:heterokaryon incompatibility het-6 [Fusarium coicis]